ncbi:MAG: hypothetical protein QXK72_04290, partial [Candidatus Bathyarchaeia archaeon]
IMSREAPSLFERQYPTGTPPEGMARTIGLSSLSPIISARRLPASHLSLNMWILDLSEGSSTIRVRSISTPEFSGDA